MTEAELKNLIMCYLEKFPNAQDTAEGILDWWVCQELMSVREGQIRSVLSEMVDEGLLVEIKRSYQETRYRLA